MRIETRRLLLRPIELGDLDEFVALHNDPDVTRFIRPLEGAAAEERLHRDGKEWSERGHGMFAVLDRENDAFLGRCGLKHWPQFDETEVGWALRRDAWGHGYATEAGRACIEWGFADFDFPYLTAMISPDNASSVRVAERLGFNRLRHDQLLGDPVVVYALQRGSKLAA
jgi:RimJ/RimL family protein N-acetyltransferase